MRNYNQRISRIGLGLFTFCIALFNYVNGNRVFDKMYENIQSDMACFKRFNGTHEIGCTSGYWGNVGVIQVIEDMANLTWLINEGPHPPYVLAVIPILFTLEVVQMASESGKVSGILLLDSKEFQSPQNFSGDQTCPNKESSMYTDTSFQDYCEHRPWNPYGSSILLMSWNFPIFLLNEEESIKKVIKCYKEFNKPNDDGIEQDWPLCAVELYSNMYATTNSEVCLRRSQKINSLANLCDPFEDLNVWGSIYPLNISNTIDNNSVIIVSTSADSASLFDNISPGANAVITGIVTLLVTAEALYRNINEFKIRDKLTSNILFVVFEGEAWDYIGSSRMVYDMLNKEFPYKTVDNQDDQVSNLNLHHIRSIIDIKQTGFINKGNEKELYLHTDPISNTNPDVLFETEKLTSLLENESDNWSVKFKKVNGTKEKIPLPPSSFQSFLKKHNISGTVITDHEYSYANKYYMSIYDNADNLNFSSLVNDTDENDVLHKNIAEAASVLASSLYKELTGERKAIEADKVITNNLLYCFLKNMNCSYFQENSDENLRSYLKPVPAKTFISVKVAENTLSILVYRLLSKFLGTETVLNETTCKSNNTQIMNLMYFPYINNGTCYETTVHHSSALSPAFTIKDYDWQSKEYSTWTESTWHNIEARIFLRPSPSEEIGLLVGGIISVILSVISVYFLNTRASIIFDSELSPTPC